MSRQFLLCMHLERLFSLPEAVERRFVFHAKSGNLQTDAGHSPGQGISIPGLCKVGPSLALMIPI